MKRKQSAFSTPTTPNNKAPAFLGLCLTKDSRKGYILQFDYYYGSQADQFTFIRIPKKMLVDEAFSSLSIQAKLLYGVLLDRMSLSMKNNWLDDNNRVYITYQIAEIQDDLGFSRKKSIAHLKELEAFGLIEKKRRGLGLPNIIYVKSFMEREDDSLQQEDADNHASDSDKCRSVEMDTSRSSQNDTSRSSLIDTSGSSNNDTSEVPKRTLQEVPKTAPYNKTNINKTKESKTKESQTESNHIISISDAIDDDRMRLPLSTYANVIKDNIAYDSLVCDHPIDKEIIDEIYELILETVSRTDDEIAIAGYHYPSEVVKSRMLKIKDAHVEYVIECMKKTTVRVSNIKSYLLAALFNAPATMSSYYDSQVRSEGLAV